MPVELETASGFVPDDVRSVVFLFSADGQRVVLLERAAWKQFAPGRWTGIGGKLEGDEVQAPESGALRELQEETGLTLADVRAWRFVADVLDPGAEVRLVYFTAVFPQEALPPCNEGTLHWVPLADSARYDLIENTRAVLETLLASGLPGAAAPAGDALAETPGAAPTRFPLRGVIQREAEGQVRRLALFPPG